MTENQYDTIIIGSGLGGLLCGHILGREGMRVCVLEKHSQAGGAMQTFKRKGITFDTGIHYIGGMDPGQNLNRYFTYFGLAGKLKLRQLNKDRFDVIALGNAEYPLAQGYENFTARLLPCFPDGSKALSSYIDKLEEIRKSFSLYNLETPKATYSEDTYRSRNAFHFYRSLSSGIRNPESLSAVLAGNSFLYAGNKVKTPLHIPALINHSFISSAWRLVGGSNQVADLLAHSIRGYGGTVRVSSEVKRIFHQGKSFILELKDGEKLSCDRVIAAIHPRTVLGMTDPAFFRKAYSERIRTLENTPGSFAVYIVLKENSFPYLDFNYYYHRSHNVWYEPGPGLWPQGYLLHTPACDEKGKFAKSLVIMTYMDFKEVRRWERSISGKRDGTYYEFKEEKADQLLALAEMKFPGLRSEIAFMETSTPLTWRDYTGTPDGSMYGVQKDCNNPALTAVLPTTKVPGFFFTGQNANLHGMLGVTIGSVMTCSEILGYEYLLNKIRNA